MFIRTQNEIISLMPTARWDKAEKLLGYLEEEERHCLEPLLGERLYQHLLSESQRLHEEYTDITSATVDPTGVARENPEVAYADVCDELNSIQAGRLHEHDMSLPPDKRRVPEDDMLTIELIRYCQRIEFYNMLAHKAGMLGVSFNEGGGMNTVSGEGYEPADEKRIDRMAKDAFMSAGRNVDGMLLFLEADAKGRRLFTELWQEAPFFYLHKDLLFQTAVVLNEYLDIKSDRQTYVDLVRDIRFCQTTYLKPRIGAKLLKAVVAYANNGFGGDSSSSGSEIAGQDGDTYEELLTGLRTALAFYVEARRTEIGPKKERLARRDSMSDAQQAMATVCELIAENLDALGEPAVGTPIYKEVRAREEKEAWERSHREQAEERRRTEARHQQGRKMFSAFPPTHRNPETK